MKAEAISRVMTAIAEDIIELVQGVLANDEVGNNIKVGRNTLVNSNLYDTLNTKVDEEGNPIIYLFMNDYIGYIERGRERYRKPKVPIDALRDWAMRKNIPTDNSTLFAIQNSIFKLGIRPRPIMYYVFEELDNLFEKEYFDKLFEAIISELNEYFK